MTAPSFLSRRRYVGHRSDHHLDRGRAGRRVYRRRSLLRRLHRHSRRCPRDALRGAGANPPGCAPPLRRDGPGQRPRPGDASRSRLAVHVRPLPEGIAFPGIDSSPAFVRSPEGNGCAERFIRTLKENLLWVRTFKTVEELRQALLAFRETYNTTWLIERHGFLSPAEYRRQQLQPLAQAA